MPRMQKLLNLIKQNEKIIKNEFDKSKTSKLENLINLVIMDAIN